MADDTCGTLAFLYEGNGSRSTLPCKSQFGSIFRFHDTVNSPSLLILQSSPGPSPCTAKGRFPLSLTQEDCVLQAWEAGDLSAAGLLAWVWDRPKTDRERVLLSALTV